MKYKISRRNELGVKQLARYSTLLILELTRPDLNFIPSFQYQPGEKEQIKYVSLSISVLQAVYFEITLVAIVDRESYPGPRWYLGVKI